MTFCLTTLSNAANAYRFGEKFRYPVSVSTLEPFDRNVVVLRYEFEIRPNETRTQREFFNVVRNCEDYIAFRIGQERPLRAKRIPKAWRARRK